MKKQTIVKYNCQSNHPYLVREFQKWLDKSEWKYEFCELNNDNYIFRIGIPNNIVKNIDKDLNSLHFRILVKKDFIQSYAYPEIELPEEKQSSIVEFLMRANFGLNFGSFEFDYKYSKIRYHLLHERYAVEADGMKDIVFLHLLSLPIQILKRYFSGIKMVAEDNKTPCEAIEYCEKKCDN